MAYLQRVTGMDRAEIESRHTDEQAGLLFYFARRDEFDAGERLAKMTAIKLAETLAPAFGAS